MTCGDPSALVDAAEEAAFELRLDDARASLDAAEAAFSCAVVDPDTLARFFDVEAALEVHAGDLEAAKLRFRAARSLAPDGPDKNFGSKIVAVSTGLPRVPVDGTIDLTPRPQRYEAWVDAEPVTVPVSVTSGLHLVQVGPPGEVAFGELVLVESGGRMVVSTRLVEGAPPEPVAVAPAPVPVTPPPPARRKGPAVPLLVTSGAMLALGGASAALALHEQNGVIPEATSLDAVDAAWTRQKAFGWTAYGLWGGAVVVGGLAFF